MASAIDKARKAAAQRQADIDEAVAAIKFPLPRPEGLTREEIKQRAADMDEAVAGIDWTPPDGDVEADRRTVKQRNDAIEKAVKGLK